MCLHRMSLFPSQMSPDHFPPEQVKQLLNAGVLTVLKPQAYQLIERGQGYASVEADRSFSEAAAEKAHRGSKVKFWAKSDRTCDDLQDPAAERDHMVDEPNAESRGDDYSHLGRP
jgi:hypothetical protein